ncbi:MAG TPA: tetratricopeptide repeat protein [Terriglobales bacterium]|nr:tetratricopeptide repeat protein [Terriglobales bacterium]
MKKTSILLALAFVFALMIPSAFAQTGSIKGVVKDDQGKPLTGAVVELTSKENGRKYQLKVDKGGNIFSLGIAAGTYDVKLLKDGQAIWAINGFPVKLDENKLDIDLAKEHQAAQQNMSEQQKQQQAQNEAIAKENVKIKGLNEKLAAAKAAMDSNNPEQAVQVLTEATQVDPNRDILWFKLGDAQRSAAVKATDPAAKKAAFEGSIESYNKAIQLAGNAKPEIIGAAYNNVGEAYAKTGQTDQAIKSYEQAAQVNPPGAGGYYFNEGAVLTNTGKVDDAIKAFDKTIQADPNKAAAYYWKGVNMMGKATLKGNKMEAPEGTAEAFNKYLELEPTGPYADPAKQMLASIGADVQTSFGKAKSSGKKK